MLTDHVLPAVVCCCGLLAGPCTWRDCQNRATCRGNRVEPVPGAAQSIPLPPSSTNTTSSQLVVQQFRLVAPHHKSERWRGRRIEYQLPQELCLLLHFHLKYGLRAVMRSPQDQFDTGYGNLAHIFVMPSTRKPLIKQQPSQVWKRVVLPSSHRFGPQVARSAFATGIRNQQLPRPEFSAAAAAEAMGHSIKLWNSTYDRLYTQQSVQTSVDRMSRWRQQVLQQQQAAAAAAAAEAIVISDDDDGDGVTAAAAGAAAAAYDLNDDEASSDDD